MDKHFNELMNGEVNKIDARILLALAEASNNQHVQVLYPDGFLAIGRAEDDNEWYLTFICIFDDGDMCTCVADRYQSIAHLLYDKFVLDPMTDAEIDDVVIGSGVCPYEMTMIAISNFPKKASEKALLAVIDACTKAEANGTDPYEEAETWLTDYIKDYMDDWGAWNELPNGWWDEYVDDLMRAIYERNKNLSSPNK